MSHDFERLFTYLKRPEPPTGLAGRVFGRIRQAAEARNASRRTAFYSVTSALSFAAMIVAGQAAVAALAQSGFVEYASLIFSDAADVLAAGQSFLFATLESFPALPVAATLASFALLFESARRLSGSVRRNFNPKHSF